MAPPERPGLSAADVFSYRLMCVLMSVIMLLGVWIIAALVRRWWVLLVRGEAETVVKFEAEELA